MTLSPGFLNFSQIPDIVWQDFSVSGLRLRYMGNDIFKLIKAPLTYIGDRTKPLRGGFSSTDPKIMLLFLPQQ